ncbi:MAG: lipoate--protein ligase [Pirellulaceae bacterium]|nr:MAG: lipoate--protein ligase [Pirellulaceae bacterium]
MDGLFLIDQPRSGVQNMAVDDTMLEHAARQGEVMLRVYRWEVPTLSLGYFQRIQERETHGPSLTLPCVRRATGGGAIVHHYDWTYAVALPQSILTERVGASQQLYHAVHEAVTEWLATMGIAAATVGEGSPRPVPSSATASSGHQVGGDVREPAALSPTARHQPAKQNGCGCPFLCFERRNPGDVVAAGWKLMGSAQRRRGGAVLQHGSLLVRQSCYAPSLPGLWEQLGSGGFESWFGALGSQLTEAVMRGVQRLAPINWRPMLHALPPSPAAVKQYAAPAWTQRR